MGCDSSEKELCLVVFSSHGLMIGGKPCVLTPLCTLLCVLTPLPSSVLGLLGPKTFWRLHVTSTLEAWDLTWPSAPYLTCGTSRGVFSVQTPVVPSLSLQLSSCKSCHFSCWLLTRDFASYLLSGPGQCFSRGCAVNSILLVTLDLQLDFCAPGCHRGPVPHSTGVLFLLHLGATIFAPLWSFTLHPG